MLCIKCDRKIDRQDDCCDNCHNKFETKKCRACGLIKKREVFLDKERCCERKPEKPKKPKKIKSNCELCKGELIKPEFVKQEKKEFYKICQKCRKTHKKCYICKEIKDRYEFRETENSTLMRTSCLACRVVLQKRKKDNKIKV